MRDRDQVKTEDIGASYFLQSREFARGVDDVRAGRPPRFDDIRINDQWRICFTWTKEGPADVEIVDYH